MTPSFPLRWLGQQKDPALRAACAWELMGLGRALGWDIKVVTARSGFGIVLQDLGPAEDADWHLQANLDADPQGRGHAGQVALREGRMVRSHVLHREGVILCPGGRTGPGHPQLAFTFAVAAGPKDSTAPDLQGAILTEAGAGEFFLGGGWPRADRRLATLLLYLKRLWVPGLQVEMDGGLAWAEAGSLFLRPAEDALEHLRSPAFRELLAGAGGPGLFLPREAARAVPPRRSRLNPGATHAQVRSEVLGCTGGMHMAALPTREGGVAPLHRLAFLQDLLKEATTDLLGFYGRLGKLEGRAGWRVAVWPGALVVGTQEGGTHVLALVDLLLGLPFFQRYFPEAAGDEGVRAIQRETLASLLEAMLLTLRDHPGMTWENAREVGSWLPEAEILGVRPLGFLLSNGLLQPGLPGALPLPWEILPDLARFLGTQRILEAEDVDPCRVGREPPRWPDPQWLADPFEASPRLEPLLPRFRLRTQADLLQCGTAELNRRMAEPPRVSPMVQGELLEGLGRLLAAFGTGWEGGDAAELLVGKPGWDPWWPLVNRLICRSQASCRRCLHAVDPGDGGSPGCGLAARKGAAECFCLAFKERLGEEPVKLPEGWVGVPYRLMPGGDLGFEPLADADGPLS
jgi:hypothetical protein